MTKMTKKKAATVNAIQQAELILKLYELRREAVMREARSYVGGDFLPASASELIQIVSTGDRRSSFVLQVYGYWEMVAAFVTSGALDAELLYNTCPEVYFQYAKIQTYLAQFREEMNLPEFLINVEQLIEGSRKGRKRLEAMQKNLAAIAEARSRPPIKPRAKK
ncbi:DUF4760 domain-containing protein [Tunturibacter empetritectus]|uniref:Uncharacterized protein n=1 Tax=Tunturiibacter lichenicola TaxID=2051959 RepID=A0A852VDF0_9BACT|nr:hypothetical protein [Edaphobacter lichenicola]NYF89710.1 hypothetical protein [Edaphobacter lichenicola]